MRRARQAKVTDASTSWRDVEGATAALLTPNFGEYLRASKPSRSPPTRAARWIGTGRQGDPRESSIKTGRQGQTEHEDDGTVKVAANDGEAMKAAITLDQSRCLRSGAARSTRAPLSGDGVRRLRELFAPVDGLGPSPAPRPAVAEDLRRPVKKGDKVKVKLSASTTAANPAVAEGVSTRRPRRPRSQTRKPTPLLRASPASNRGTRARNTKGGFSAALLFQILFDDEGRWTPAAAS